MSFLLDTNVVSEWTKPRPNSGVIAWLEDLDEDRAFLSVITLTKLRYGVERLSPGNRKERLQSWLEADLPLRFEGRVIPVDAAVADACGRLVSRSESAGHRLDAMDALIAATAAVHALTLVTQNVSHFRPVLQDILTPWD